MRIKKRLLSVIIPAYKQEKTIKKDLENIHKSLSVGLQDFDYEIICVVDGKIDKTFEKAQEVKSPKIKVVGYEHNKGKGYAVRFGMARSKGELISFLDAGMEISPASIMMLIAHLKWYNADIIVGSKRHPVSRVNYPLLRRILTIGYHLGVKILFGLPLSDTQSGIKIFKRRVMEKVLPRLLVKQYAMDIEMLAVAKHLAFHRIYEAPIEVRFDKKTSQISWKTVFKMALDTLAVFYRLKILRYYDDGNERKWKFDPELDFRVNIG
jgi:glycosyltransferase involved in cell wall biosynthesis